VHQVIQDAEDEKAAHSVVIQNLTAAQREREQEKAAAAATCVGLTSKVAALETKLLDKDRLLHSMQQLLYESASSHRSLAADLESLPLLEHRLIQRDTSSSIQRDISSLAAGGGGGGAGGDMESQSQQLLEHRSIQRVTSTPVRANHHSFNGHRSENHSHAHSPSLNSPRRGGGGDGGGELGGSAQVVTCEALFILASPPLSADAIVASDSPIKGITFSRVVTDFHSLQLQNSPRTFSRTSSPRMPSRVRSPRRSHSVVSRNSGGGK
jgi:hypothetical protein